MSLAIKPSTVRRAQQVSGRLPAKWDRRLRELGKHVFNYRGFRATGMRGIHFRLLGRYSGLFSAPYGEGRILVDSTDDEIGRMVFMKGDWERLYLAAALDYIRAHRDLEVGPVFIDVGANIGTSTLDALLHCGFQRAICFEPDSRNFRILRMNVLLNDFEDRVTCHRMALSDSEGEAVIERARDNNFGDTRVVVGSAVASEQGERVQSRRLDNVLRESDTDVDQIGLLWIDAQGHDPFVLAGAASALEAGVPVVTEYFPEGMIESGTFDLFERLVAENYSQVIDLRQLCDGASDHVVFAAADVADLRQHYRGNDVTDLLLLR